MIFRTIRQLRLICLPQIVVIGMLAVMGLALPANGLAQQPVTPEQVNAVARELWCPLCNSVRLDTCELKACEQMPEVIADKLAAGASVDDIRAYFIAQYGPQVLGEPPRQGFSWLAWVAPFAAIILAAVWLFFRLRRWTQRPAAAPAMTAAPADPALSAEQLNRLQEELKKIG